MSVINSSVSSDEVSFDANWFVSLTHEKREEMFQGAAWVNTILIAYKNRENLDITSDDFVKTACFKIMMCVVKSIDEFKKNRLNGSSDAISKEKVNEKLAQRFKDRRCPD